MTFTRLWLLAGLLLPLTALADAPREPAPRTDLVGDPLPRFARARLGSLRYQHGNAITSVCYLPGGKELASYGLDRTIRVWERDTGRELRNVSVPGQWVISADKRLVAAFYENDPFQILDLTGATEPRDIADVSTNEQLAAAFSGDGTVLAVASSDVNTKKVGPIRRWELSTGRELPSIAPLRSAKKDEVVTQDMFFADQLIFSPDGRTLAALGNSETASGHLRLFDVASGKAMPAPEGQEGVARGLIFAPDSKTFIAVNGANNTQTMKVCVWETATGKKLRDFAKFQDTDVILTLSPDGKVLAAVELGNGAVQLWEVTTGKELKSPPFGGIGILYAVAFTPDSRTLAGAFEETEFHIGLWDVTASKEIRDIKGVPGDFFGNFPSPGDTELGGALMFAPDGKEVAVGGASGVHRWDPATGKEIYSGDVPPRGQITKLALSPDGKQVAAIYADQVIRLWDLAAVKEVRRFTPPAEVEFPVASDVAFSPDGQTLAIGWYDGRIQLWDMAIGKQSRVLEGHANMISSLAFAPNSKTLASADAGGDVIWWDHTRGRLLRRFAEAPPLPNANEAQPVRANGQPRVTFAADGKALVGLIVEGESYRARVWELASGEVRRDVEVKPQPAAAEPDMTSDGMQDATGIKLSPDGKTLLWVAGPSLRLWDVVQDKEIRALPLAGELVEEIAFAPDGRSVAGAGRNGSVRLWDVATGKVRARLLGHRGGVSTVAFSSDGQSLLSGGNDGTLLVWDAPAASVDTTPARESSVDWDGLADRDARRAYQAICRMVAAPRTSVPLLSEYLKPAKAADSARVARLLADLESNQFVVRNRATLELEKLGELVEAAVRKRLADNPPLEVSQRLEKVLERLAGPVTEPERLRVLRAIEVLEQIGTPEAQAVLRDLAGGTPEARLSREAKEALQRLER